MAKGKRINRYKVAKIQAYIVLILLVVVGFVIGRVTKPVEIEQVTITETIEVPTYEADKLPELSEIFIYDVPLSENLQRYIYEVCADEEVPVALVLAMIEHESGFNPEVISATDDCGLMQINEVNYEWLEEDFRCVDMTNPYQNVFCGIKIIGQYLEQYEDDYTKALMAYNMGNYGAKKAWANGVENTRYTTSIMALFQEYEEVKDNATLDSSQE